MIQINKNIKNAIRKFKIILLFLCFFQITGILFLKFIILDKLELDFNVSTQLLNICIICFFSVIYIIVDIIYVYKHIYIRNSLINTEVRECIIEDFIITYYKKGRSSDIKYYIEPVIRDINTNQIYFTYSDYNLSYYNSTYTKQGKTIVNKQIFRKDGSFVNVGDKAFFYIRRILNVNVDIDSNKNIVYLKTKNSIRKMRYQHVNDNYDINKIKNFIFFEGIVEVENIKEN